MGRFPSTAVARWTGRLTPCRTVRKTAIASLVLSGGRLCPCYTLAVCVVLSGGRLCPCYTLAVCLVLSGGRLCPCYTLAVCLVLSGGRLCPCYTLAVCLVLSGGRLCPCYTLAVCPSAFSVWSEGVRLCAVSLAPAAGTEAEEEGYSWSQPDSAPRSSDGPATPQSPNYKTRTAVQRLGRRGRVPPLLHASGCFNCVAVLFVNMYI
ncbi:unnamed protein product [Arctogadus glacialis]